MKKKYYKLITNHHRSYSTGEVRYIPGGWTYAPGNTRLFVFETYKEATDFWIGTGEIWECEVTPSILRGEGTLDNRTLFWNKVEQNLKNKKKWDKGIKVIRTGVDACLVKGVKLTKKIN